MRLKNLWATLVAAVALFLTTLPVAAEEIYVRNKPYEGEVIKMGSDRELRLDQLAEALGEEPTIEGGRWAVNGGFVPLREIDGKLYVILSDLDEGGFQVTRNDALETIDIHVKEEL